VVHDRHAYVESEEKELGVFLLDLADKLSYKGE